MVREVSISREAFKFLFEMECTEILHMLFRQKKDATRLRVGRRKAAEV